MANIGKRWVKNSGSFLASAVGFGLWAASKIKQFHSSKFVAAGSKPTAHNSKPKPKPQSSKTLSIFASMNRIAKIKEFLQENPADNFLRHALALEHIKEGDDAAARSLFEAILSQSPDYVGSYYHLAKLLERAGETDGAIAWYEKGMAAAKAAGDQHAYNELQGAYEDLVY